MWRGHPHKIFQKDPGVGPKDCWKIQAITNWLGMGRSSWRVKKTRAVSLTTANCVLAPAAVTFVTGQVTKPEKLIDLTRRAMHCQSDRNAFSCSNTFMKICSLPWSSTETWKCMSLLWCGCISILKFRNNYSKKKSKMWWKWLHIHPRQVSCQELKFVKVNLSLLEMKNNWERRGYTEF